MPSKRSHILGLNGIRSLILIAHPAHGDARLFPATDREIDRLVYELYGLTEEEIKMVESAVEK
jgi:hypothetical protein